MDSLTLDQIQIFLRIVDAGSFSKAARTLNRAQSAVTYGIQKLEAQIGLSLFDRAAYRPELTEAGRSLLVRARRIAAETNAFRESARGLSRGLEAELTLMVDSLFPMDVVVDALRAFSERFPTVPPRVYVESLGAAAEQVLDGTCAIGLLPLLFSEAAQLTRFPILTVELIPVVAPHHPLAACEGPIDTETLQDHVQLVLTDRSTLTAGQDHGVLSSRTWRLADLGTKHSMLVAGLGWGNMPSHLVADDIRAGRLKTIQPQAFEMWASRLTMCGAHRTDNRLGPAGQWMIEYLSRTARGNP